MPRKASQPRPDDPVARVTAADRPDLLAMWSGAFARVAPPRNISLGLLRRAVAYKLQETVQGGLRPSLQSYLRQVAEANSVIVAAPPPVPTQATPGTRLIREWNGRSYEVSVEDEGCWMDGQRYRSLTEVAKVITGTNWSGPRFFGLVKVKSK